MNTVSVPPSPVSPVSTVSTAFVAISPSMCIITQEAHYSHNRCINGDHRRHFALNSSASAAWPCFVVGYSSPNLYFSSCSYFCKFCVLRALENWYQNGYCDQKNIKLGQLIVIVAKKNPYFFFKIGKISSFFLTQSSDLNEYTPLAAERCAKRSQSREEER